MKKIMRLVLALTVLVFSFGLVLTKTSADETLKATNVRVEIMVNENNVYEITETIDIEFATPHHGIIRSIPTDNSVYRQDGSYSHNHAIISSIETNVDNSVTFEYDSCNVRMGSADVLVEGSQRYILSYKYEIGNDEWKGGDEFYFNIIGDSWDYDIEHLQVIIHFPKDFDMNRFGVTHGYPGSTDYHDVMEKREDNTVYLEYFETLKPGEAFTVRCEFEEGYFKKVWPVRSILTCVFAAVQAIVLTFINRRNYVRHGKPDVVVTPVEFYPPEGLTPPQMYNVMYGYAGKTSINGMLLLLADKGYLKIEDIEEDNYRFVLSDKSTEGLSKEEIMYLEGLEKYAEEQDDGTLIVTRDKLRHRFYRTINDISDYIRKYGMKMYEKKRWIYITISVLSALHLAIIVPVSILISNLERYFRWYHLAAIGVGIVFGIYQFYLACRYKKRTEENNKLYGRILGFKDFIEVAEKDRIIMLVEENPNYFYDILPYAYALGITDFWISRFADIAIPPVSWYEGTDVVYFMDNNMNSFQEDSTGWAESHSSSDGWTDSSGWSSSSDSGGGSGGGYSGSGSGGGGSSGW